MTSMTKVYFERENSYSNIRKKICQNLLKDWPVTKRLPPIRELAQQLKVGHVNTHRTVRELVEKGILISRPGLGTYINNDINNLPTKMKEFLNESSSIEQPATIEKKWIQILRHVEIPEVGQSFLRKACDAFMKEIASLGYRVTLEDLSLWKRSRELFTRSDALVFVNPADNDQLICEPSQVISAISSTGCCEMMNERFDLVSVNDIQSSSLAGAYLKKLGWEDVCFIGQYDRSNPSRYEEVSQKRLIGLEKGLGRPIRPECQLSCYAHVDIDGAKAVSQWLNITPRPQAIFAASDDLAFGFINGAYAHGLKPGRDYQIIGFDGQQQSKDTGVGVLTTVVVPMEEMGTMAAQLLSARLKNPIRPTHQVFLGCHLLEGNTVTPKL